MRPFADFATGIFAVFFGQDDFAPVATVFAQICRNLEFHGDRGDGVFDCLADSAMQFGQELDRGVRFIFRRDSRFRRTVSVFLAESCFPLSR